MTAKDVARLKQETTTHNAILHIPHLIKFISNMLLTKPKKNNIPAILVNELNISREK